MTKEEMLAALHALNNKAKELGIVVNFDYIGAPVVEEAGNENNFLYIRFNKNWKGAELTLEPRGRLPFEEEIFLTNQKYK